MDSGGARFLCETRDQLLDLLADDHHEIREFVDDHDDERQTREFRHVLGDDTGYALDDLLHADRILDRIAPSAASLTLRLKPPMLRTPRADIN